ncbi:hypothetical protein BH18ACT12_BH18ACT12_02890 [soil metagenome]
MLYWAEGEKNRNAVRFTNADPEMVRFFTDFLRAFFKVRDEDLRIKCSLFADHVPRQQQIERFWLDVVERRWCKASMAPFRSTEAFAAMSGLTLAVEATCARRESGKSHAVADDESNEERHDRELIELLNELRVALPGVQVLFAFLLTVPFSNGFPKLGGFDRDIYFVAFIATAVSTVLLIAPSSYHRLRWRQRDKERMLVISNYLTIAGLAALAVAITATRSS